MQVMTEKIMDIKCYLIFPYIIAMEESMQKYQMGLLYNYIINVI